MTAGAIGADTVVKQWADWEFQPTTDVAELHITEEQFAEALKDARADAGDDYSVYGFRLWHNLVLKQKAYIVTSERLVDRLPPRAFGTVGSGQLTHAILEWSRYRAPDEAAAVLAFKTQALAAGWRPAQVNSYFVALRPMEAAMLGGWRATDVDPMPNADTPPGLDRRQAAVFAHMRANPAFAR